eukprot:CAMPEP_0119034028 /NCGR_PEP_ID=MMETSP1177-20130426/1086_1 /TAXON_ID=2985 /ORGANISM="Ochromonas sp, Strain CCMP1899" /LENGTH=503 /DNA_ID=CAMNT_0006991219 /DNA_START=82 /DNA_END=1593 /DNA_ORIENTATION=+
MSSESFTKYAFITVTSVTALYFILQRKKKLDVEHSSESFINSRNGSWFDLPRRSKEDDGHPEGPNIGYNSNSSWFGTNGTNGSSKDTKKGEKLLIALVGLPNSGKTLIARKISRYLRWISYRTRAFSIAKYRLDRIGPKSADFFDPNSADTYQKRISVMTEALDDAIRYLDRGGDVAILDGTNVTRDRRKIISDKIAALDGYDILWVESSTMKESDDITEQEFEELKQSPDFLDRDDYVKKMALYRRNYEPLEEEEGSFIKVFDDGRRLTLHKINGFLRTKIVSFVMNLHRNSPPVYFSRHGESDFNKRGLIGGDSKLTERGHSYGKALDEFLNTDELPMIDPKSADKLSVWTSSMRRARDTAKEVKCKKLTEWRSLREIEVGVCDGLSYDQIKSQFPDEHRSRSTDKLNYRYPRGESYMDVIQRLEPIIFELERQQEPLLIIAHQAVLRCLYAYFLDLPTEEIPFLSMPLHTLIRLEAKAHGCKEKRMRIVMEGDPVEHKTR